MESPRPGVAFTAVGTRRLRRAGVAGRQVRVALAGGGLVIEGEAGGVLRLEASAVERLRAGYEETKFGRVFQTMIWPRGAARPLVLHPAGGDTHAYGETIRAFAAALAQAGGIGRVERGVAAASALFVVALTSVPALAYSAIALALAEAADWPYWLGGAAFFWAFAGVFIWHYRARQRPLPVRDLAELDQQLPGPNFRL